MIPGRIENATRVLGPPPGWEEATGTPCSSLPILDADGGMYSAWSPSPEEIDAIVSGASVILWIAGGIHPPVAVAVGRPPE